MTGSSSPQPISLRTVGARFSVERFLLLAIVLYLGGRELVPGMRGLAQGESHAATPAAVLAPSTAFTYQGRLEVDGLPANGTYDLAFNLWDDAIAGNLIGTSLAPATVITNGLFSATLNFNQAYTEGKRTWVETIVDPPGAPPATSLGRTELTVPTHDHLYQDWLGSSDGSALSLRNLGQGDALSLEASGGNALSAISGGSGPVIDVSVQGTGTGVTVNGGSNTAIEAIGPSSSSTIRGQNTYSSCFLFGGCFGVAGYSSLGSGVAGFGKIGVLGEGDWGVYGTSDVAGKAGVRGDSVLVSGCSTASVESMCYGVYGDASQSAGNSGVGVSGRGTFAGVYGQPSGGGTYGGYFLGTLYGSLISSPLPVQLVSDRRAKKDVSNLAYGLDDVLRLRPVSYRLVDGENDRILLGLIAQEVREVIPEAIDGDESDGYLSMTPDTLLPVLIKAIQEQQAEIEGLRANSGSFTAPRSGSDPSWPMLAALAMGALGMVLGGAALGVTLRRN